MNNKQLQEEPKKHLNDITLEQMVSQLLPKERAIVEVYVGYVLKTRPKVTEI